MTSNSSGHFSEGSTATSDNESCDDVKSWQSTNSSLCSSCSDSESDVGSIEWESEVRHDGELYYITSDPISQSKNANELMSEHNNGSADAETSEMKDPAPKSWRNGGKLVRLIRRRESKRHRNNTKNATALGGREKPISEIPVSNSTVKEGSVHFVELNVDPWVKRNLGRRATISETLLGLVTVCHESEIYITDYVPDSLASKQSLVKIGDKIVSINGKGVTPQNFNALLEAINMPMTLNLGVCTSPIKSGSDKRSDKQIYYQTPLAERISGLSSNHNDHEKLLSQLCVGVLYLQLDGLTEGGPEDQGVLYCYPGSLKSNFLSSIRGAFLTLFQLIPDISQSPPKSSSILVKGQLVHVIYVQEGRELLLIAVPDCRCSVVEAVKQCSELVQLLKFTHQSLSRCFSSQEHVNFVNHVMCIFFLRLYLSDKWAEVSDVDSYLNMTIMMGPAHPQFEAILPAAHLVPLPREAQMQIDDALSELESNDIGDSCEDIDCQRPYTILGCCLYHKGLLLASHLTHGDLLDVHVFCRQQALLQLNHSESVRSLVIWKEVFPFSVSRGILSSKTDHEESPVPEGRWFIMIVGQKQDMLVTLLEAGGCSASLDGYHSPDVFYVEAAQDTLQHLRKTGVSNIASEWLETQLRPKLTLPEVAMASRNSSRRVNSLLGLRVHHDPIWQNSFSSILNSPSNRKSTDSLSAGKRRPSPDHSSSGPLHGGDTSEDSASLVASLPSDDTVFMNVKGRSERGHSRMSHSDQEASEDSDSDWEASDTHAGHRPTSTTDLSDLHNSLLKNVEGTVPSKLSTGAENTVFHYVHIDTNEGILLSPVHSHYSTNLTEILSKFRSTAMHIHSLFQNTISFKKLKGIEASHSLINKSLVAIKEFGALFEYNVPPRGNEKPPPPLNFWVVGRLFFMPASREVYVCYEDSAPQNLVELAFRLALTSTG